MVCLLPVSLAASCGEDAPVADDDEEGASGGADRGAGGSDGGAGGAAGGGYAAGGSGTGGAGAGEKMAACLLACSTASDCDLGAGQAWDADNYACESGGCVYTGCKSDAECQAQGNMVCRTALASPADSLAVCVYSCGLPSDCDLGAGPAWDADNYACESGGCVYTGCNSDAECQGQGNQVCRDPGIGLKLCHPACASPQDCDLGGGPAYDADNYACREGACIYLGCNSVSECTAQGDYVCVSY